MIVVDTSVWIDHFRDRPAARGLEALLEEGNVLQHPWVTAELVLGGLSKPARTVLGKLPSMLPARDAAVVEYIHSRSLEGSGVGWVDAALLAAAHGAGARLWTLDGRLHATAERLRLAFTP